jgi:hypothetical protein
MALGKDDKDPPCKGGEVACTVDPCLNKSAICQGGTCTISAGAES